MKGRPKTGTSPALAVDIVGFTIIPASRRPAPRGYVPYLYAQGLIERGWRVFREPLETHWQSYMDDAVDLTTAIDRLIGAIHAAQPQ